MATINDFLISDFIVSDVQPLYSNQANSGRLITRSTGIQYFRIEFTITLKTSDRLLLQQFLAQQSQGNHFLCLWAIILYIRVLRQYSQLF